MVIKILNPTPGGATHIGIERAKRHVRNGRAQWEGGAAIRFIAEHHRGLAARRDSQLRVEIATNLDRAVNQGMASNRQMRGVPIINSRELLAPVGKLRPRPPYMRAADVNAPAL